MTTISRLALAYLTLLQSSSSSITSVHAVDTNLVFSPVKHVLPQPLSDMSATYDSATNHIYLVGGCDDPQGNAYRKESDMYACTSLTAKTWAYNPDDGVFLPLDDAPRKRYRHTAANVEGKIWVLGGRTVTDELITEIDVYDPISKTWSTVGTLPPELQRSDQASFADGAFLYILGGYDAAYTASKSLVKVDTAASELVFEPQDPMAEARGDVHAVTVNGYAYVTGGFTHDDGYCQPLTSTERYDFKNNDANQWTTIGPLHTGRADKALVAVRNHVYAVGGESKHDEHCNGDPGEYSLALADVEVLDTTTSGSSNGPQWTVISSDMEERRFRFVGAPWPRTNSVYVLGGQYFYEPSCKCFATSDIISKYTEKEISSKSTVRGLGITVMTIVLTVVVALL